MQTVTAKEKTAVQETWPATREDHRETVSDLLPKKQEIRLH